MAGFLGAWVVPPTWVGLNDNVVKRFAQGYKELAKGHEAGSRGRTCPQGPGEGPGLNLVCSGPESASSSLENLLLHTPGPQSPHLGSQQAWLSEGLFQLQDSLPTL